MPLQVQVNNIDASANGDIFVEGILVPSGSYPGSAGDTIDFTQAVKGANFSGIADLPLPTSQPPKQLWVGSQTGNLVRQYAAIVGSALNNSKFVLGSSSFGSAQGNATYASLTDVAADTIGFQATFKKLL